jgi:hypothetical protein
LYEEPLTDVPAASTREFALKAIPGIIIVSVFDASGSSAFRTIAVSQ